MSEPLTAEEEARLRSSLATPDPSATGSDRVNERYMRRLLATLDAARTAIAQEPESVLPPLEPIPGLNVNDLLSPEAKAALNADLRQMARTRRTGAANAGSIVLGAVIAQEGTEERLRAALADLDRAATFDLGECDECGAPPEDGHSDDCSRAPLNGIADARERIEDAIRALSVPVVEDQPEAKGPVEGWRWAAVLQRLHRHGIAYETLPEGIRAALAAGAAVPVVEDRDGLREALDRVMRNVVVGTWYDEPEQAGPAVARLHDAEAAMWRLYDEFGIDPGDAYTRRSALGGATQDTPAKCVVCGGFQFVDRPHAVVGHPDPTDDTAETS